MSRCLVWGPKDCPTAWQLSSRWCVQEIWRERLMYWFSLGEPLSICKISPWVMNGEPVVVTAISRDQMEATLFKITYSSLL
ncbi:hypothetical protein GDO81_018665 [Engystomops pustulosus]|uniref:Uncharacterized protein n=1 Tax=Engystomops pustulosus TaxID=76066 RepID=A0AAV6YHD2_ENGPU|nr:hypothetical protein GDO81_018665 [Engystomops pustulosus]